MFGKANQFGAFSGNERAVGGRPLRMMGGMSGARLSLTSATPVTTADVTNGGTLFLTEYASDRIMLMTEWAEWRAFRLPRTSAGVAEVSRTFTANSDFALVSATVYDIFAFVDINGEIGLQRGTAWTSATARAVALARLDGAWVLATDPTRLYLGTIYASGTNTCDDSYVGTSASGGNRYVWNAYNRVLRHMGVIDTTNSWTYTTATWRQANAAAGNAVRYVQGLAGDPVRATVYAGVSNTTTGSIVNCSSGVGIDSTTVNSALLFGGTLSTGGIGGDADVTAIYLGHPGIGYHALNWLEISQANNTTTWYGDNGLSYVQSGMFAEFLA